MSIFNVELFAKTVRKEWMIENNLHWHLDYTLKEDGSTIIDKKEHLILILLENQF